MSSPKNREIHRALQKFRPYCPSPREKFLGLTESELLRGYATPGLNVDALLLQFVYDREKAGCQITREATLHLIAFCEFLKAEL